MKKLIIGLTFFTSISSFAGTANYSNDEGCLVEKEQRNNGVVLYISKDDQQVVIGYGNNYEFGDFTYCAEDKTDITFYSGTKGTGILISCSGHTNGHAFTRGRADISLDAEGRPASVLIDGQKKGFFGWSQEIKINCSNLVQE